MEFKLINRGGFVVGFCEASDAEAAIVMAVQEMKIYDLKEAVPMDKAEIKHHCHAIGCKAECPPAKLMCLTHWNMVPLFIQRAVSETFNPEQCSGRVRPSGLWLTCAFAARCAVQNIERAKQKTNVSRTRIVRNPPAADKG